MPKTKAGEAKQQLQVIDRDLYHLRRTQWIFSKRMLKVGIATWVLGIIMFILGVLVSAGVQILQQTFNIWMPFLIIALVAPIVISALFVHKIVMKINRLERNRKNLMERYEKAMLKKVGKMVSEG